MNHAGLRGSLQSLDWNGGLEWWNHKYSAKMGSRDSNFCLS